MSDNLPVGDSLTHRFAKLHTAAETIDRLAAEYHSAVGPVREALQAVADVPLNDRDRWASVLADLAVRLLEVGMDDVPKSCEGLERWSRQFDAGKPGSAFAGKAFCTALAAAIANGSPPTVFFSALDQHSFITTPIATQEVCAVLSHLLFVHTQRTVPSFAKRYGTILADAGIDAVTLRVRLAQCGMARSSETAAAVHDWDEFNSGNPCYHVAIRSAADRETANDNSEGGGETPPTGAGCTTGRHTENQPMSQVPLDWEWDPVRRTHRTRTGVQIPTEHLPVARPIVSTGPAAVRICGVLKDMLTVWEHNPVRVVRAVETWDDFRAVFCDPPGSGLRDEKYTVNSRGVPDGVGVRRLICDSSYFTSELRSTLQRVVQEAEEVSHECLFHTNDTESSYEERLALLGLTPDDGPVIPMREALQKAIRLLALCPTNLNGAHSPPDAVKKKPDKTMDAILPTLLSASEIAKHVERNQKSVTSFLSRFAAKYPDCRVEIESKRRNEPNYLYRTADVWPAIEKWLKDSAAN